MKSQKTTFLDLTNIVGLAVFFLLGKILSCSKYFINTNPFNPIVKYMSSIHDLISSEKKLVKDDVPEMLTEGDMVSVTMRRAS